MRHNEYIIKTDMLLPSEIDYQNGIVEYIFLTNDPVMKVIEVNNFLNKAHLGLISLVIKIVCLFTNFFTLFLFQEVYLK